MKFKWTGVLIAGLLFLSGCNEGFRGKIDNSPYATKTCNKALSQGKDINPALQIDKIVVYKKRRKLTTYKKGKKIDTFRISLGKNGDRGDKVQAGDYRTPVGTYSIVRKKCDNRLYRSLMISYPNRLDRKEASRRSVKPGGYITIHGQPKWNADGRGDAYTFSRDWTEGCIAVSNKAMDRLWAGVKKGVKIDIHP